MGKRNVLTTNRRTSVEFDFLWQLENIQKTIDIISVGSKFTDTLRFDIVTNIIKIKNRVFPVFCINVFELF